MPEHAKLYKNTLDVQRREIRTIRLEAGAYNDDLTYTLKVVSLDEGPYYEALSYVWGLSDNLKKVSFNNEMIKVTRYLEIALRHLRETNTERVLWIDAICINQKDVPERNLQVELMDDIYRSADQVLVWLVSPHIVVIIR